MNGGRYHKIFTRNAIYDRLRIHLTKNPELISPRDTLRPLWNSLAKNAITLRGLIYTKQATILRDHTQLTPRARISGRQAIPGRWVENIQTLNLRSSSHDKEMTILTRRPPRFAFLKMTELLEPISSRFSRNDAGCCCCSVCCSMIRWALGFLSRSYYVTLGFYLSSSSSSSSSSFSSSWSTKF